MFLFNKSFKSQSVVLENFDIGPLFKKVVNKVDYIASNR
jgi:hypothetical protein